jgi:hypothetical protein
MYDVALAALACAVLAIGYALAVILPRRSSAGKKIRREGGSLVSLDRIIGSGQAQNPEVVLEWGLQLISAIEGSKGRYVSDFSPDEAWISQDGSLVLNASEGVRLCRDKYEPPEEFALSMGKLKNGEKQQVWPFGAWLYDPKVNVYKLGMILLDLLKEQAMRPEMAPFRQVAKRCVAPDPSKRYVSLSAMGKDLEAAKLSLRKKAGTPRRYAAIACIAASLAIFLGGGFYYQREGSSELVNATVVLTKSKTAKAFVEKRFPDGAKSWVGNFNWTLKGSSGVASISNGVISGNEVGETSLEARYMGKIVNLDVKVVEPQLGSIASDGQTSVVQYFQAGKLAGIFAGDPKEDLGAGGEALEGAVFSNPRSIAADSSGNVFIADGSGLKAMTASGVKELDIGNKAPLVVKSLGNDVYALVEWLDEQGGKMSQILKVSPTVEEIMSLDTDYKAILDFAPESSGLIHYITENSIFGSKLLETLSVRSPGYQGAEVSLPDNASFIEADGNGAVYVSCPDEGAIYRRQAGSMELFAGLPGDKGVIDGEDARFYQPSKLKWRDGSLYVWDFNVLRKVIASGGKPVMTLTLAGGANPDLEMDLSLEGSKVPVEDISITFSKLGDFAFLDSRILLLDQKRRLVWEIEE